MIHALIVAYEAPESVERLLGVLLAQSLPPERVIVVDNGRERPVRPAASPAVEVIVPESNLGVAGAFEIAMLRARRDGARFLWVFDQDSEPGRESLERLVALHTELTRGGEPVAVIAPEPIDRGTGQVLPGLVFDRYRFRRARPDPSCSWYRCDAVIASGSLVDIDRTRDVALPDRGLFMDAVDWRFCMSCRERGLSVVVSRSESLGHRLGNGVSRSLPLTGLSVRSDGYPPSRYFYIARNHTYLETRLARERGYLIRSVVHRALALGRTLIKISLFERDQLLAKWRSSITGFVLGLVGRVGVTPRGLRGSAS